MQLKSYIILAYLLSQTTLTAQNRKEVLPFDPSTKYDQKAEVEKYKKYQGTKERLDLAGKSWKIRSVIEDERRIREEFDELKLIKISNTPYIKNIVDMDSLEMHTKYPLTLMLPQYSQVTNAYCYPPTVKPLAQFNVIDLIPSDELLNTTLVVTYLDASRQIKRLLVKINKIQNKRNALLYREVRYIKSDVLSVEEVLSKYYYAHNRYPKHNSMIRIGRNVYTFIKDNINGTLRIDGSHGKFIMKINQN